MTISEFDLYGLKIDDIENAKTLLENILCVEFKQRYSDYKRGDYYSFKSLETEESFTLQKNYAEFEDEWIEDEHREYLLLFYVDNTNHSKEIFIQFEMYSEISLLKNLDSTLKCNVLKT